MILWYVKKTYANAVQKCDIYVKGTFFITADYRRAWIRRREYPVVEIGTFHAFWGCRPCIIKLSAKEAKTWIAEVQKNAREMQKKIKEVCR